MAALSAARAAGSFSTKAASADELAQERGRRDAVRVDRHEGLEQAAQAMSGGELRMVARHLEQIALGIEMCFS
jgi:hypothetical protein